MNTIDHGIFNLVISGNTAIMDFNPEGRYDRYPNDLVDESFRREITFIKKVKKYDWAPELLSINHTTRQITFRWYDNTCEDYVPENFTEQLLQITKDLHLEKLIKPNLYTRYFYTDTKNRLHTYAFYTTSTYIEQPININFYKPILNEDRQRLVDTLTSDGYLDMRILLKHAYKDYIKWPGDPLPKIYEEVHE